MSATPFEEAELQELTGLFVKLLPLDGETVRHWSYEAEHIAIARTRQRSGQASARPFQFVLDGSVSVDYDVCECACSSCTYHSCNCDNCDDYNDDPEHCSDSDCTANEICPREPLSTYWNDTHSPFLNDLADEAERFSYEDFGRLGGHVHVEARDLTRRQAVNAVVIAEHLFEIAPEWFTGEPDTYNNKNNRKTLEGWVQGTEHPRRDAFVSLNNLSWRNEPEGYEVGDTWDNRKTTIEFRRFRTTFSPMLLAVRGAVARAVVAYAKTNPSIYWVTREADFGKLLAELGFGKH
jgi:hypothetical protein